MGNESREEIYMRRQSEAGAFQGKYRDLLETLGAMPRGTPEDREKRWAWFSARPVKDDFIMDALKTFNGGAYNALFRRLSDTGTDGDFQAKEKERPSGADDGIAYEEGSNLTNKNKKKDLSPIAFMETVKKSVCWYEEGGGYTFIQSIGQIYKQKSTLEMERNERQAGRARFSTLSDDKRNKVRKFAKFVSKTRDLMDGKDRNDWAKIEERVRATAGKAFTDREFADARAYVELGNKDPESFDTPIRDGEGGRLIDTIEDPKGSGYELTALSEDACRDILEEAVDTFELIKVSAGIEMRDVYQSLFTKSVLKSLKLEIMHPATPYNKERNPDTASGNDELYTAMMPMGTVWYKDALYRPYVHRAVDERPEILDNLYAVYYNPLREDFNPKFTDRQMAEVLGVSTAKLSHNRKVYEDKILPEMYDRVRNK